MNKIFAFKTLYFYELLEIDNLEAFLNLDSILRKALLSLKVFEVVTI